MVSAPIGRSGRRRWTAKQRQRFLARFHQNQLTQRDFATRHGVGLSTLSKWLRVENEVGSPPVKFQEVILPDTPMRYAVEVVSPQGSGFEQVGVGIDHAHAAQRRLPEPVLFWPSATRTDTACGPRRAPQPVPRTAPPSIWKICEDEAEAPCHSDSYPAVGSTLAVGRSHSSVKQCRRTDSRSVA